MTRVGLVYLVVIVLELLAFSIYRSHPLVRPGYFDPFVLCIELLMCWGGLESARWLLRRSPAARSSGPGSDWTRLWCWLGPFGGLLFLSSCLLGSLVEGISSSPLAGFLVIAHFSGGAVAWSAAGVWALGDLISDPGTTRRDYLLVLTGYLTHAAGFAYYLLRFPGQRSLWNTPSWLWLFGSCLFFYFLLFYIMSASLCWALGFLVWQPAREANGRPRE